MKQMRSRFRLITLLLVCGFLLALAVCTGNALKTAGVSLTSLSSLPVLSGTSPAPSVFPSSSPAEESTPLPAETPSDGSASPATDIFTDPEYNVFGL